MKNSVLLGVAMAALSAVNAFAHVSLETGTAKSGATYKAVLRVPHGCDGAATTTVRVRLPEGVISVKPMPKAGWKIEKSLGEYAKAYDYYGEQKTVGVQELIWSGGHLGDDEYEEFVFRAYITETYKAGDVVHFPVVQECEGGATERWIEVPAAGKVADDYEHPAPSVTISTN